MASISRSYSPRRIHLRSNSSSFAGDDVDATSTPTVLSNVISETSTASTTDATTALETSDEPPTDRLKESAEQIPQMPSGTSSDSPPTPTPVPVEPTPETPELAGLQLSTIRPDVGNASLIVSTEVFEEEITPQETPAPIRVNDEATETTQDENLSSSVESISETGVLSRPAPTSTPEPTSDGDGTFTGSDDDPINTVGLPPVVPTGPATESGDLLQEGAVEFPQESAPGTDQGGPQENGDNGADGEESEEKEDSDDTAGRNDQNRDDDTSPPDDVDVIDDNETGGAEPESNTSEPGKETQTAADNSAPGDGGSPAITQTGTAVPSLPTDIFSGGDDGGSTDRELAGSAEGNDGLSGPQKAGIIAGSVIGSAILFALIAFLIWYIRKRRRDRKYQYVIKTPMVEQPPALDPIPRSARLTEAVANIFKPTTASNMSSRVDLSRGNPQFSTDGQPRSRALSAGPIGTNGNPARNGQDPAWPSDPGSLRIHNARPMGNAVAQLSDPFADTNAIATSGRHPADPFHDSQAIQKSPRLSLVPAWDPRTARPRGSTTGSIRQTSLQPGQPGASAPIKARPNAPPPGRTNVRSDQFDLEIAFPPAALIPPVPRLQRPESYTSLVSTLSSYSQSDHQNRVRVSRFGEAL
ncbi:uncharacterized protein J7T54_007686 [Emericellopsis cladophorae]|uniref:Uncharacterized protein n=1 Tax=Emericellopsis cladophorae TaxID=2686198 RepID=A0A9P9XY19_9HYPO|nr:uncharacterized protein J7T54_007686 [Emericellopsis cladophorae]KAI6779643.1 hypothetical protein J7T54_007686 [Emericellopsis cladophorae]